jgi:prepilin-type N-terminal cleavage/methylation domain-containing protein
MKNNQKGFSLIELILVVLMIGIVAAIAIPSLTKAVAAAENGSTLATMKTVQLAQSTIFSQKSRYGNLNEVNQFQNNSLGQVTANQLFRGKFLYEMIPANPTPDELKLGYIIKASRISVGPNEIPYVVEMNERGVTTPIFP